MTKLAQNRATKAILLLQEANNAPLSREFPCRKYDSYFEQGDGTQVICSIMKQAFENVSIMRILGGWRACRFVSLKEWKQVLMTEIPDFIPDKDAQNLFNYYIESEV